MTPGTSKLIFSGPPETVEQIAAHELSHVIAACLAMWKLAPEHYNSLIQHVEEQKVGMSFSDSVPDAIQKRVNAVSALGPIALAPIADMDSIIRFRKYETCGLLSCADISVLHDVETSQQEKQDIILATRCYFERRKNPSEKQVSALIRVKRATAIAPTFLSREYADRIVKMLPLLNSVYRIKGDLLSAMRTPQKPDARRWYHASA